MITSVTTANRPTRGLAVAAMAVALAGCGQSPGPTSASSPEATTPEATATEATTTEATDAEAVTAATSLVVTVQGGLCPEGPCRESVRIDAGEGTWEGSRPIDELGAVEPAATVALIALVVARWDDLVAEPFDDVCPTAYDGQELVLDFTRLPTGPDAHLADADVRSTSTCTHAWPHGFAERLREAWMATGARWPAG